MGTFKSINDGGISFKGLGDRPPLKKKKTMRKKNNQRNETISMQEHLVGVIFWGLATLFTLAITNFVSQEENDLS